MKDPKTLSDDELDEELKASQARVKALRTELAVAEERAAALRTEALERMLRTRSPDDPLEQRR